MLNYHAKAVARLEKVYSYGAYFACLLRRRTVAGLAEGLRKRPKSP